ncbi:MAG: hypothetical protein ABJN75_04170 [Hoeflea sp.]|uniref:hypothetical protein n=1 Tax=Hoeflea sp. TaxID=1940281 RepID=UPI003296F82C
MRTTILQNLDALRTLLGESRVLCETRDLVAYETGARFDHAVRNLAAELKRAILPGELGAMKLWKRQIKYTGENQ